MKDWRADPAGSILELMSAHESPHGPSSSGTIRVGGDPDGLVTYLIDLPPEAVFFSKPYDLSKIVDRLNAFAKK